MVVEKKKPKISGVTWRLIISRVFVPLKLIIVAVTIVVVDFFQIANYKLLFSHVPSFLLVFRCFNVMLLLRNESTNNKNTILIKNNRFFHFPCIPFMIKKIGQIVLRKEVRE